MTRSLLTIALVFLFFTCSDNSDDSSSSNLTENPALEVTNSVEVTTDENNFLGVDDVLTYTISVKNVGDVTLNNINLTYNLSDNDNNILSLDLSISFVSSDADSSNGILLVDETATYTATYTITQTDVAAGGLSNSITANGISPQGESISDISDDGDDTDGNLINDATTTLLTEPLIDETTIAQYHVLDSDGNPYIKYYFDTNGQIERIYFTDIRTTPHVVYNYHFTFDSEQKLIYYSKNDENDVVLWSNDIVYDSQNRVMSIGERQIEFVDDNGSTYYIDLDTYSEEIWTTGDIEYTEIYYYKYYYGGTNPILSQCNYSYSSEYNTVTEEFDEYGGCGDIYWSNYTNGNVSSDCSDDDCVFFSHNSNTNPLYGSTNLINLHSLIDPFGGNYNLLYFLYSENNLTLINYSDPSSIVFSYIFNDNNLPVTSTRQYFDELGPGTEYPYGNYYYQGDTIPD